MKFFVGGIGKDNSWCLVSEHPFMVEDKRDKKWIAVATLKEAASYYESDAIYTVYVWDTGIWKEIHFLTMSDKPASTIEFKPSENPN